jgi:hypothetical protein
VQPISYGNGNTEARVFGVNTSLSSVLVTVHVQKLERHEIDTNLFRKAFYDVIV